MMGFNDMMSGWGWGIGWSMYLGMIVFWVAIAALVIWVVRASLLSAGAAQTRPGWPQESAVDVLKRRYAAGEIDAPEFEQKRRDLF